MLNYEKSFSDNTMTVLLEGRLDSVTTPVLAEALADDIKAVNAVVFDMTKLQYISSAGLRLLLTTHKTMMKKGGLALRGVNEANMQIFQFTGFTEILHIE